MGHTTTQGNSRRRARLRWHIAYVKRINEERRSKQRQIDEAPQLLDEIEEFEALFEGFPPLPPRLPQPEYATDVDKLNPDDPEELEFYIACRVGHLQEVKAFIQDISTSHAVRQFGLQQASFGNQPAVAKILLANNTALHGYVFEGTEAASKTRATALGASLFETFPEEDDTLVPLLQTFMDAGWHPNQAWEPREGNYPKWALQDLSCICNKPLTKFLLSYGADPNIGPGWYHIPTLKEQEQDVWFPVEVPFHRHGIWTFGLTIETWNPRFFELLRTYSVPTLRVSELLPLLRIARDMTAFSTAHQESEDAALLAIPFSMRRDMAEHMLSFDDVGVDDVKWAGDRGEQTALTLACATGDWEYAEWLLEKGADPSLLDGIAFAHDPQRLVELMSKAAASDLRHFESVNQPSRTSLQKQLAQCKIKYGITRR
ncbi:hypothetical protein BDP81DRAFT_314099 [Colletotrichum phormii]|uniref:Ankyrin repeat protein n=1 Tax=Colletotrichum phormii TaxID=359342 RepID=A0AAJ0EG08_9PEZI|nr:uncharacterized protein BDP81DRAFT_314099 [Colletotrichum phormii]KAK1638797.1 hypothetical protein BDP81DRAFT_314099 [Colletotrichum phormii]